VNIDKSVYISQQDSLPAKVRFCSRAFVTLTFVIIADGYPILPCDVLWNYLNQNYKHRPDRWGSYFDEGGGAHRRRLQTTCVHQARRGIGEKRLKKKAKPKTRFAMNNILSACGVRSSVTFNLAIFEWHLCGFYTAYRCRVYADFDKKLRKRRDETGAESQSIT